MSALFNSKRHPKWTRVEPGATIKAGQPYRVEPGERDALHQPDWAAKEHRGEPDEWKFEDGWLLGYKDHLFVDSSWTPPLVLPTEPTWGIIVIESDTPHFQDRIKGPALWVHDGNLQYRWDADHSGGVNPHCVLDFIPLTDEQVARIEAAR